MRTVANGMLVFADPVALEEIPNLAIKTPTEELMVGAGAQLTLNNETDGSIIPSAVLDKVVWTTSNGMGFINQKGYLIPSRVRKGPITAFYGPNQVSLDVNVIAKPEEQLETADVAPASVRD